MFPHPSRLVAILTLALCACGKEEGKSAGADPVVLRARPEPVALPPADSAAALPEPLLAGGGDRPLTDALDGGPVTLVPDERGRPWGESGARPLKLHRKLADTEFFLVLRPRNGDSPVHGLLAANNRAWDNFIQFSHAPDGPLHIQAECERGGRMRTTLAADKGPAADAPRLIHLRPVDGGQVEIRIDDQSAGRIRGALAAWVFGRGYATAPSFRGQLGEIIAHQPLGEARGALVKSLLAAYWGLPGGDEQAFADGFRHHPAIVGGDVTAASSGALTLRLTRPAAAPVYLGSSPESPPTLDDLPAGATLLHGTRWRLHAAGNETPEGHVIFPVGLTLGTEVLGDHGFHALFHRADGGDWREVAATYPDSEGDIIFPVVPVHSGEYQLAVVQGVPQQVAAAHLVVHGAADGALVPGSRVRITAGGTVAGQPLTLREMAGGTVIYQGPAGDLDLPLWILRNMKIRLSAGFGAARGVLAKSTELELATPAGTTEYHPGLLATLIRDPEGDGIPPARAFAPPATDPPLFLDESYRGYPVLRDAESVRPTLPETPGQARFSLPARHHLPVPSLTIASGGKIAEWGALVKYPFDDFAGPHSATLRIEGVLLVDEAGIYRFQLESNLPARLDVGGAQGDGAFEVSLAAGAVPLALTTRRGPDDPSLACRVLWQPPGAESFVPLPAGRFAHPLDPIRARALAAITGNFASRQFRGAVGGDDRRAVELLELDDDAMPVAEIEPWIAAVTALADAFMSGRQLAGDPRTARAALRLVDRRLDHLRHHPEQLRVQGFGKTDGRMMRLFESLRPFFWRCECDPRLQIEALDTLAGLTGYAVGTCLSRSFFSEAHAGTNDGYGDDHNLLVNFWRAAAAIETTHAWDAAANLLDSHFHFTPDTVEGLGSDGIYQFHRANGRQIHMGGYGVDWLGRVLNTQRFGSPWALTPEQYRRVAMMVMAYEWLHYRGTTTFSANGRHNTHAGNTSRIEGFLAGLAALPEPALPPDSRREVAAALERVRQRDRESLEGNRFFYRNLNMIHRRADWFIDLKMNAPLVAGPETFAGAFPWNMAFGDGVTTLLREGNEYRQIHRNLPNATYSAMRSWKDGAFTARDLSLWQYRALPGTTMLDDEAHAPDRYRAGGGDRAGGVSDGRLGHAAFHFVNRATGNEARKMFGFTEDGMAVLGCGITTLRQNLPAGVTMRSTLNHCDGQGEVRIRAAGGQEKRLSADAADTRMRLPLDRAYLIEHAGTAYLVQATGSEAGPGRPGTLCLDFVVRTPLDPPPGPPLADATAEAIRSHIPPERKARIFHLWIDHGPDARDATAAWFVHMAGKADADWLQQAPIEILSNHPSLQALRDRRDGVVHAFFHRPGRLESGGNLLLESPSAASLMWNPTTRQLTGHDPLAACTRDLKAMAATLEPTLGPGLDGITGATRLAIPLPGAHDPDDRYRGAPVLSSVPAAP
jgi:hypothetical protein